MASSILGSIAAAAFSKVCENGTHHYYRVSIPESDPMHGVLLNILHENRESKYTHWTCFAGGLEIAADMLCFRNPGGRWDYSDHARMKVRIQYNPITYECIVMCKKKYQLETFLNRFRADDFSADQLIVMS